MPKAIIFDFDGTLIDSASAILKSMRFAFKDARIKPMRPLKRELIGPPLSKTMATLVSERDRDALPQLLEKFKNHYDEIGYRETRMFAGVGKMLIRLSQSSSKLYIATNKRIIPTLRIIEHLELGDCFEGIFSLDSYDKALPDKDSLLRKVCWDLQQPRDRILYIGDRQEDAEAAEANHIHFLQVAWGYEKAHLTGRSCSVVRSPGELVEKILGVNGV